MLLVKKNNFVLPFLVVLIPFSLCGQTAKPRFALSTECLITRDFSTQSPDIGKSFYVLTSGFEPAFGVMVEFPIKNNLWLSTGYRWKRHWIGWASGLVRKNIWVETAHSIPFKVSWKKIVGKSPLLNRVALDISGGFLINKMSHPLIIGYDYNLTDGNGSIIYSVSESYNSEDINQVEATVSLDGAVKVDYRIYKNLHLYVGYGYTQGFWRLAKGNYRYTATSGIVDSGRMSNYGSYQYGLLGLRMSFK